MSYYTPAEIAENTVNVGIKKVSNSPINLLVLGFLAGSFVALAAQGTNLGIHTIESVGIAKLVAGTLFTTALLLVLVAGAELFTGNCLIVMAVAEKKVSMGQMLYNWFFVYFGNLLGGLTVVLLIAYSGQLATTGGLLGAYTIKVAAGKTALPFDKALIMGILCNWVVCLGVWVAYAAKDLTGKILAPFFPIWLFVTSGFEHCVANMYYIPAGILAKSNPAYVEKAMELGVTPEKLEHLNWYGFFVTNLIPVTIGNIIGGSVFVGLIYWFIYIKKK